MRLAAHLRRHAVGYLALFVALGGTSYAAIKLPKNSVGTKQLRNGAVTTKKIAASTRRALHGATGPQGPAGAPGTPGAGGAPGLTGPGAVRFGFERTADPASPSAPQYTLASSYGVVITAPCVSGGVGGLTTTLQIDPDATGHITTSYDRRWEGASPSEETDVTSAQILAADPPSTFFGFQLSGNDTGYAHVSAGFDNGSRTVLIEVFVRLESSSNRCLVYGALWPAT